MKSDIPEGATHKTKETDILDTLYYKFDEVWWCYSRIEDYWFKSYEVDRYFNCLELIKQEKQMDNIYTQEMHDAGELPKVGMKCNVFDLEQQKEVESVILSVFDSKRGKGCVCESDLAGIQVYEYVRILPIKEKTDKEKAIELINNSIEIYNSAGPKLKSEKNLATWLFDDINDGVISGVTLTENKND